MHNLGKYLKVIAGILIILFISHFFRFGPGTHGKIKGYQYTVTKFELEKAIDTVLKNSETVSRQAHIHEHLNDGINYVSIDVYKDGHSYEYVISYYGDSTYWKNSPNSEVAVVYAWDWKGNGGSEGNGNFTYRWWLKRKLTSIFESEFIEKVDKQLGKVHVVDPD